MQLPERGSFTPPALEVPLSAPKPTCRCFVRGAIRPKHGDATNNRPTRSLLPPVQTLSQRGKESTGKDSRVWTVSPCVSAPSLHQQRTIRATADAERPLESGGYPPSPEFRACELAAITWSGNRPTTSSRQTMPLLSATHLPKPFEFPTRFPRFQVATLDQAHLPPSPLPSLHLAAGVHDVWCLIPVDRRPNGLSSGRGGVHLWRFICLVCVCGV